MAAGLDTKFDFDQNWKADSTSSLQGDAQPKFDSSFDFDPQWQPPKQNTGLGGDLATDIKRGVQKLPGALTGLADIPIAAVTGDRYASRAAEAVGKLTGFEPGKWAEAATAEYSPQRKAGAQAIDQAWKDGTAADIAGAYLSNPGNVAGMVAESLPSMVAGGLLGRAALTAGRASGALATPAANTAAAASQAIGAGAVGEGTLMAGQAMDNISDTVDARRAAAAAAATGIVGGAMGVLGGAAARRMGVLDPEALIAGAATSRTPMGMAKRMTGGAISEGLLEELPQSVSEQAIQNLAEGKPVSEGVARAAIEGAVAGGVMGAGFNALPTGTQPETPPQPAFDPNAGPMSRAANKAVEQNDAAATMTAAVNAATAEGTGVGSTESAAGSALEPLFAQRTQTERQIANVQDMLARVQQAGNEADIAQVGARLNELMAQRDSLTKQIDGAVMSGAANPAAQGADPREAADPLASRLTSVASMVEDKALMSAMRSDPRYGKETVTDVLAAYAKARNPSFDQTLRERALQDLEAFTSTFVGPNTLNPLGETVTLDGAERAQGAPGTAVAPASQGGPLARFAAQAPRDDGMTLDGEFRTPAERMGGSTAPTRGLPTAEPLQAKRNADAAYEQGFQDLVKAEQLGASDAAILADQRRREQRRRDALRAEIETADADARNLDARERTNATSRLSVLESVLADPETRNPATRFVSELRRQGYTDIRPTKREQAVIKRYQDVVTALDAADSEAAANTVEPSAPNQMDAAEMGIRERQPKPPPAPQKAPVRLFPFANRDAAQRQADKMSAAEGRPYVVGDHPVRAGAFAAMPAADIPQSAQTAANVQGAAQSPTQAAPAGLAAVANSAQSQSLAQQGSVTNGVSTTEQVAQEGQAPRGQEGEKAFAVETGTLGVPRAEMPQVPAKSHGGLVRHLNAQGIAHETTTVDAASLKPTQDGYSPDKVEAAKTASGDRAVIVSSDGHIVDGHHQALAAAEEGKKVKAIVLDAPIVQALEAVKSSPSARAQQPIPAPERAASPAPSEAGASSAPASQPEAFDVSGRTDAQLAYLAANGQPGWKEAAITEMARRDEAQPAARAEIDYNGTRIYPYTANIAGEVKGMWAVESSENKAKREAGQRAGGGDSLHDTLDQAKAAAARQRKDDAEREAFARLRDEQESARKAAYSERRADTINGFLDDKPEHTKELVRKALDRQVRFDGDVMTVRRYIELKLDAGDLEPRTTQEPKIKPMSRTQYNRATNREQDAHEKKMREAGNKTVYTVNGFELGKYAHDYAQHLLVRMAISETPSSSDINSATISSGEFDDVMALDATNSAPARAGDEAADGSATAGTATATAEPLPVTSAPFAAFEQLKTALKVIGRPAELQERLSALGIASTPTKTGVTVQNRMRWDEVRANIPVHIDTYRVEGVPSRLADVTLEVMASGEVVLKSGAGMMRYLDAETALREYSQSYGDAPAQAPAATVAEATHKDPGQPAETVTVPVIAQAIQKSARNTEFNATEAKAWLIAEIDRAIANVSNANAELQAELDRERAKQFDMKAAEKQFGKNSKAIDAARMSFEAMQEDRIAKTAKQIGFVTFDVPGDGKFRIVNTVEKLNEFKSKVKSSPGFAKNPDRPMSYGTGLGSGHNLDQSIADAKKFGGDVLAEIGNAIEIARLRGKGEDALLDRFKENSGGKSYDDWRAEQEAEEEIAAREAAQREASQPTDAEQQAFMDNLIALNTEPAQQAAEPEFHFTAKDISGAYGEASAFLRGRIYSNAVDTQHKGRLVARLVDAGLTKQQAQAIIDSAQTLKAQESRGAGPMTFIGLKYLLRAAANRDLIAPVNEDGRTIEAPQPVEPEAQAPDDQADEAAIESELDKVPENVRERVAVSLRGLREVYDRLANVKRARGEGQILALEVRDMQPEIARRSQTLDTFREQAARQNIDAGLVIRGMGGEPDFAEFGTPAAVEQPEQPTTIFGFSGAQLEAMQGGKMAGIEQFPGIVRTDEEIAQRREVVERRKADQAQALDAASNADPRIAALKEAGVEASALLTAEREARDGDDSLIRDLARINNVTLPQQADQAEAPAAEPEQADDRLTTDQARALMTWEDRGQRDNVRRMNMLFFENKGDMKAGRGGMVYGTIESYQGGQWNIDGTNYPSLKAAKAAAVEQAIERLRNDGYVEQQQSPFAKYDEVARAYGYEVREDGAIGSDGTFPGPTLKEKSGRLRVESGSGKLLGSYAAVPESIGKFLESFWSAEKKPKQGGESAFDGNNKDTFTVERVEDNERANVTFRRGEPVKIAGSYPMTSGPIEGISQSNRQFKVGGVWYDFGYAYKSDYDEFAGPRREMERYLSAARQRIEAGRGFSRTDGYPIREARTHAERYALQGYDAALKELEAEGQRVFDEHVADLRAEQDARNKAEAERLQAERIANAQAEDNAPVQMTMDEWKRIGRDFKSFNGGNRTAMIGGRIRAIEIIKPAETDSAEQEAPADATPADATLDTDASTLEAFRAIDTGLREGTVTLDQYRAAFASFMANKASMIADLNKLKKDDVLALVSGYEAQRLKTAKKDEIVNEVWGAMRSNFALGREFGPQSYFMGQRDKYEADKTAALQALVENTTADDLKAYASQIAEARAERIARTEEAKQKIENPQTLEDFRLYMRVKTGQGMSEADARLALTPEQRRTFDDLAAAASREARKGRADAQRTDVRVAAQTTSGEVVETQHTKTGEPLFVVRAADRVERDVYEQWNTAAKRLGGRYSSYRGNGAIPGFTFKTREAADAFLSFLGGDATQAQQVAQQRRNAFEDDRSQSAVERLTEMADRLEERADEAIGADRKTNTARRANMAASAMASAEQDKALARTMRNIAQAIQNGAAQFLDRVRQKTQVEMLSSIIRTAKYDELRAKYPIYADQQNRRGELPTVETVDYTTWPTFTAYRSDLARLGRELEAIDGAKKLGQRLLSVADDVTEAYQKFAKENFSKVSVFTTQDGSLPRFASREAAESALRRSNFKGRAIVLPVKRGVNVIVMGPAMAAERGVWAGDGDARITLTPDFALELIDKAKQLNAGRTVVTVPHQFESVADRRAKFKALGIETASEMRAALREFVGLMEGARQPTRAQELERAMVGRQNDGLDFFPTSGAVIEQMLDAADLRPGMAVLEPSAGMGHIADSLRAYNDTQPHIAELSSGRAELLEAKGYEVVGRDFMEMKPSVEPVTAEMLQEAYDEARGQAKDEMRSAMDDFRRGDVQGALTFVRRAMHATAGSDFNRLASNIILRGNGGLYDRIIMNPPFSDRRDAKHVQHAYSLLKPGGRIVAIMGEGVFFGQDKRAQDFRDWLDSLGGTSEKLPEGSFMDPTLPVQTGVNARMVVIDKPESGAGLDDVSAPSGAMPGVLRTGSALPDTITVDGKRRPTRNSNGQPIHPTEEGVRNFWKWFGDSRVVDAEGRPLVVYHGTGADVPIDLFDRKHMVKTKRKVDSIDAIGNWFTDSAVRANDYGDKAVYPAYLKVKNPRIYESFADLSEEWRESQTVGKRTKAAKERAKQYKLNNHFGDSDEFLSDWITGDGFDGIVIQRNGDGEWKDQTAYLAIESDQAKSATGNNGDFSANSPSILLRTADNAPQRVSFGRVDADAFLAGFVQRYPSAPDITIVNTFDQLPAAVQKEARNQGSSPESTKGVMVEGQGGARVYLVSGNHASLADFEATVFHEVQGHAGVRALYGNDFVQDLNAVFLGIGGQGGLVKIMNARGMGAQAQEYIRGIQQAQATDRENARQAKAEGRPYTIRWTDAVAKAVLTEEVYAHIAEQMKDKPSMLDKFKTLIGQVRQWLRDHTFMELAKLGETDLLFVLAKARKQLERPSGGPGGGRRVAVMQAGSDVVTPDGGRLNQNDPDFASAMRLADVLGLRVEAGPAVFSRANAEPAQVASALPETITIDGKSRPTRNSNGQPIHPTEEGVRNFWKWFGDSKAVDVDGRPLVVYHGTTEEFSAFDTSWRGSNTGAAGAERGFFFAGSEADANLYIEIGQQRAAREGKAEPQGRVIQAYLRIRNPLILTPFEEANVPQDTVEELIDADPAALDYAQENGFDGVIWPHGNMQNAAYTAVAFRPEQINSATGNNGDFSPDSPLIVFRTAGEFAATPEGRSAIRDRIGDLFGDSARTFNRWWHTTVGSQYHKAKISPEFRRVYDRAHAFVDDVSRFALGASTRAKNILPHLDTWRDIGAGLNVRRQWAASKDFQAIAAPIFEGTLANGTTGTVWSDADLRDRFGLTDKQVGLYREFRDAVDYSLETLAASEMARAARAAKLDVADVEMGLRDAEAFYTEQAQRMADTARRDLDRLKDQHRAEADEFVSLFTEDMKAGQKRKAVEAMVSRQTKEIANAEGAITDAEALRDSFTQKGDQIRRLQAEGYAPLMRFGQYTVDVVMLDENGQPARDTNGDPDRPFFGMFETEAAARQAERIMREEYPEYTVTRGVLSEHSNQLFKGVTPETAELFAAMLGVSQAEGFQAYLKQAVANRSAMKRLIQRKGMDGFAQDVPRVLSSFITSNARLASGNWHFGEMVKAASEIPQNKGDVKDEAIKLVDYIQNPQEEAAKMRGFLFFSFLGGSIAAALVNTTQTLTTTLPYLSQFGAQKAAAAIARATKGAVSAVFSGLDKVKDDGLREAMKRASDEGIIDPQEIHMLMAEASGNGASNVLGAAAGMVNKAWASPVDRVTRAATQGWGSLFGMAEKYNRHVAFMAAWEVGGSMTPDQFRQAGASSRYEFAKNAVTETQFDYSKVARPNWARGAVGATLFTFKTFTINYLEFLSRLPSRERAIAVGALLLLAGLSGAPGADDLDDIMDTIGQKLGYNWNSAAGRHAWLMQTLGEGGANFVEHGVSSLLPLDVSSRLGMGNLIPGTAAFMKSNPNPGRDVAEVFGPAGSVVAGAREVFDNLNTGRGAYETVKPVLPKALNDAYQAIDIWQTGYYRDRRGRKVVEADKIDAILKGAGFQPNQVAEPRRVEWMLNQSAQMHRAMRADIYELWARGVFEQDREKVAAAQSMLREWNQQNPDTPIRANPKSVAERVRAMNRSSAERLVRATPREMRGALAAELAVTD